MKRFHLTILSLAIAVGVFAPVAIGMTASGASVGVRTAYAGTVTSSSIPVADDPTQHIGTCFNLTSFDFGNCVAWLVYYIPYSIGDWLLGVSARAFDVASSFTLSSRLYTSGSFLQQGWQITRDFSNIFFILILLFIALGLVLDINIGHANPKKLLVPLVLVALVINFSFFITEVVIDISNSLALVFYNQVSVVSTVNGVKTVDTDQQVNDQLQKYAQGTGPNGQSIQYIQNEKPLSVALVQAMKPQILSDTSFYDQLCNVGTAGFFTTSNTTSSSCITGNGANTTSKANSTMLIAIFLLVGIMFIVLAYCFVVALISLFGRMVQLFISIVFAPLAFVSIIVPSMERMPGFGWNDWFSGLMGAAFAAPIFFFFILLISILSQSTIIPKDTTFLSPGILLILVSVQFLILITLMLKATSYVKKASGEIGNALGGLAGGLLKMGGMAVAGAAGGLAMRGVGTATGAAAVGLQKTVGGGASKLLGNKKFQDWAARNSKGPAGFIGRAAINATNAAAKGSYNASDLLAKAGIQANGFGSFSREATAGGNEGRKGWLAQRDVKLSEKLKENKQEAAELKQNIKKRKDKIAGEEDAAESMKVVAKDFEEQILKPLKEKLQRAKDLKEEDVIKETQAQIDDAKKGNAFYDADNHQQDAFKMKRVDNNGVARDVDYNALLKEIQNQEKEVSKLKRGERGADGGQIKAVKGDVLANGKVANANDVARGVLKTDSLSLDQMEKLVETNQKAGARAYLYNKAQGSGKSVHAEYDKLGNVKDFHVDPTKAGVQTGAGMVRAFTRSLGNIAGGAALSATGVGAIVGIPIALNGLVDAIKDITAASRGSVIGQSTYAADVAHHTAEPHGDHAAGHGGHGDHAAGHGGPLSQIQSLFKTAFGSLIGGTSGGGGGGGGGGHGH